MSKKRYRYRNAVDRDATSQGRIISGQAICSVFNSILVVSSMIRPARPDGLPTPSLKPDPPVGMYDLGQRDDGDARGALQDGMVMALFFPSSSKRGVVLEQV